ncbi:alpha/beta hydrolase [Sinimarinibacterium sp. CAU 1509]|uniref:alpha/beta hydrolase n=1 Tax=Sinimarinibacterium sp. CAU 1509 TaxID=2562283 RepID=UPI0010ABF2AB|nr:alpha/beta hydrolase [Sinimarinibacterium sp. CAU 1509]TJY55944.1 alpha/beta hydrolase [Sinimarinibacterium sp. CAU 1509]
MLRILWIPLIAALSACAGTDTLRYRTTPALAYVDDGSAKQVGDLYVPEGAGPFPAVLVVHGGGWIRGERADMNKFARRLAEGGYAAYNIGYRLAPDDRFPAQLDDLRTALRWLHAHAEENRIDPDRIAVMGYSAGAHLALMLGLDPGTDTPRVRAVVAGAGPTDLRVYPDSPFIKALIGGTPDQFAAEYATASPITYVTPDDPPVMLYHGKLDGLVEVEQSLRLHQALIDAGVRSELATPPLSGHITTFLFDGDTFAQALQFLAETTAPRQAVSAIR